MLGTPCPPPAQRRLPIPARALPQARSTPEARRVLDAFLELYRHGCGERCSLYRGPRRVERHPRPVDRPSRPRCAVLRARPPACPPRYEAGAPRPRPACHRWGASPKSAAPCTTRCHLWGASLKAPLHSLACHCPLSSATGVWGLGWPRQLGFGVVWIVRGKGKGTALPLKASLSWLNSGSLQKLHLGALGWNAADRHNFRTAAGRSGVNELRTLVRKQPVNAPL